MSSNNKSGEPQRQELRRKNDRQRDKQLSNELLAIGKRCAAHVEPAKSSDHADMLYDNKGLPR